jgi:hypothetical protein
MLSARPVAAAPPINGSERGGRSERRQAGGGGLAVVLLRGGAPYWGWDAERNAAAVSPHVASGFAEKRPVKQTSFA